MLKSCCHLFIVKRSKPKSCAARLQSWDYLGQVVTNQTEPCVLCKFLHYCNAKHIKKQCQYSIKHHTYMYCLVDFVSCIIFTLIFTWNYTLYLFLGHSVHLESWHLLHLRSQAWNQIYKGQRTRHVIWAHKTKTMIQNADHSVIKNPKQELT